MLLIVSGVHGDNGQGVVAHKKGQGPYSLMPNMMGKNVLVVTGIQGFVESVNVQVRLNKPNTATYLIYVLRDSSDSSHYAIFLLRTDKH